MRKLKIYLVLLLTFVSNSLLANPLPSPTTILVMGDSLSAGYGIDVNQGWVRLLEQALADKHDVRIINASVSGETSAGGKARLPALLEEHQPHLVILELGGNDGLRGQPLKVLEKNLQSMIDASHAQGATVLLAGMQIPPNYGARYTQAFKALYPALAEKNNLPLIPFLLEGVGGIPTLMQRDGIHPTAEAQLLIMKNVLPAVEALLP